MLSLLSLIIASGTVLRADTELWKSETYPDPRTNSTECNVMYDSTLCDPDHILTDTWRQTVLDNINQQTSRLKTASIQYIEDASEECHSNTTEGVQIFVILAKRIHTSSNQSITSNDLTQFGHGLREAFGLDSMPCKNYVLVLGVELAKEIYVWTGSDLAIAKEQMDTSLAKYKNVFSERNYMEGLNKIVDEIGALLLDPFKNSTTAETSSTSVEPLPETTTEVITTSVAHVDEYTVSKTELILYVVTVVIVFAVLAAVCYLCLCKHDVFERNRVMDISNISVQMSSKIMNSTSMSEDKAERGSLDESRSISDSCSQKTQDGDNDNKCPDGEFLGLRRVHLGKEGLETDRVVARRNSESLESPTKKQNFSSL